MRNLLHILAALIFSVPALGLAMPIIDGELAFGGDFSVTGGTGGLGDATGVSFLGSSVEVDSATGTFAAAGIVNGNDVAVTDFGFNPFSGPVAPLWAIKGFEFTLSTLNVVFQSANFLLLEGTGFASSNGYSDTLGSWQMSANTTGGALFNFSSTTSVPEPATLALLGAGLISVGLTRRRRKPI